MTVRDAVPGDWSSIWPIFSEVVATGETYAYPDDLTEEQARRLWMLVSPGRTVVAALDGVIVGSATMGPNRPGRGAHIATASFMVAAAARGHGVGRALATEVIDWASAHGYHGIQFNAVVETNTSAVALWTSLGFRIMTTVPGAFDHRTAGFVGLHVMFLPLTPDRNAD